MTSALTVGLLVLAGRAGADPPAKEEARVPLKPSTERTLRLPETPFNYAKQPLPAHFRTAAARRLDNTPENNPITDHGATLGRVLFYDTRMSANNTVACASCHHQDRSFVDGQKVSKGFEGKQTDRNSMTLVELRYYGRGRFFWDERARTLEQQVLMPIQSKVEMGQELPKIVQTFEKDAKYPELFRKAFGDEKITSDRMSRALAQFLRSMVSYQSKYDEGMAQASSIRDDFPNFTAEENRGKDLFVARCASCHMPGGQNAHFFMNQPRNNGLDVALLKGDGGIGDLTLNRGQLGRFKSPSLRNIEVTGPYMHDGRLATLEDVVEHYSKNIKQHPNLDGRLRRPMNFTAGQKAALVAFMKTLTDRKFLTDTKFSDPFQ
jgi:cytochrome c peroxidase